jgi:hypothetical protein
MEKAGIRSYRQISGGREMTWSSSRRGVADWWRHRDSIEGSEGYRGIISLKVGI